jgi:hypothetical protein
MFGFSKSLSSRIPVDLSSRELLLFSSVSLLMY